MILLIKKGVTERFANELWIAPFLLLIYTNFYFEFFNAICDFKTYEQRWRTK